MEKIQIFFAKLFANKILENEVVATVVYVISQKLVEFKTKINNTININI